MAQVTVSIDGKAYKMACDPGQEPHLAALASRFDRYVGHLRASFGEIGDNRLLVMAAVMVMDEMQELEKRAAALEGELARAQDAAARAEKRAAEGGSGTERALAMVADRLETVVARLQAP
jgi:cell division protein ZapA